MAWPQGARDGPEELSTLPSGRTESTLELPALFWLGPHSTPPPMSSATWAPRFVLASLFWALWLQDQDEPLVTWADVPSCCVRWHMTGPGLSVHVRAS